MEWVAEMRVQVGDPEGAAWPHLPAFLDGFAAGVRAQGALGVDVPPLDHSLRPNPDGAVRFRFAAAGEREAERLAEDVFFPSGLASGAAAVPAEGHPFGWVASTGIAPADAAVD